MEKFNADQRAAFDAITYRINRDPSLAHFFLHDPGGTGKTFPYRTLANHYRSLGQIVLCVASTGIAALLLPGGRTAHKRFKTPFDLHEDSTCAIKRGTMTAGLLAATSLVIWDETPMKNQCFYAVHRTLKDVRFHIPGGSCPFGGIPTVFGGDLQQMVPVVPMGSRADVVHSSLLYAKIWPALARLFIRQNLRLNNLTTPRNRFFADFLSKMSYEDNLRRMINPVYHLTIHEMRRDHFSTTVDYITTFCNAMELCKRLGVDIGPSHGSLVMFLNIRDGIPNWVDNRQYNFTDEAMQKYEWKEFGALCTDAIVQANANSIVAAATPHEEGPFI